MNYLLDTCVVSDFIKGEPSTLNKIRNTSPVEINISSITVMEIEYGLALNSNRAILIKPIINDFLKAVTLLDFNQEDAKYAGILRAQLKTLGCPIGSYDVLLAGAALNRDCILVTSNMREFNRVLNLKVENWRNSN